MKEYSVKSLILDSPDWNSTSTIDDFSYPWRRENSPRTEFSASYDREKLYFRFFAHDNDIQKKLTRLKNVETRDSDRVEIFFKRDDAMDPYYCLEMDPLGRIMDFEGHYYRKSNHDWSWPEGHLIIETTISEGGYEVTGTISIESLNDLGILQNTTIQAGLYRCHYIGEEPTWISWVKPDSEKPDFHIPSSFGVLILE